MQLDSDTDFQFIVRVLDYHGFCEKSYFVLELDDYSFKIINLRDLM